MADFPTLAEIASEHFYEALSDVLQMKNPGGPDTAEAVECRIAEMLAEWVKSRTVVTAEQLDALPLNTVVVDASGIPRTNRHGDSHMPAGWTHAGRSPLKSRELADGRPMVVFYHPERDR